MSDAVLTAHLRKLVARKLIAKIIREEDLKPAYTITEKGEEKLKEIYEKNFQEKGFEAENLYDEVYMRLKSSGFALAIRKKSSLTERLTIPSLETETVKVEAFKPGKIEEEYLKFASKIYVDSVEKFDWKKTLTYIDLRAVWQVIEYSFWREKGELPGLTFDYPSAWNRNYRNTSEELKRRLEEHYGEARVQQYMTFRRLKLWSHPPEERGKIAKRLPPKPI